MRVAIVVFPGSNCERDTLHILRNVLKIDADLVWHTEPNLDGYDAAILPGGFSYGDALRAGVLAAFSPIMKEVKVLADEGKPVLGICNGFQTLVESGLLPGALTTNLSLKFVCRWVRVKVKSVKTAFTRGYREGSILRMPVAHNEGRYLTGEDEFVKLEDRGQIVFTYVDEEGVESERGNPNGSQANIAGVCNESRNVVGLMPHPERASEPILSPFRSDDGLQIFRSIVGDPRRV